MCAAVSAKLTGGGKLLTRLKKMSGKGRVTAGFYKDAKYENGTPVATVAAANNFGTEDSGGFIPPRPFFTDAVTENSEKWVRGFGKMIANGKDVDTSLQLVGEKMRSDIICKIDVNDYLPNAESTIKQSKNPNKQPLKDTYHMMRSVGYSVNDEPPQYSQTGDNGD